MPADETIDDQVEAFARLLPLYTSFAREIQNLLISILSAKMIPVHIVESRPKSLVSFRDKINRPDRNYENPLTELPDLCGCRIITYYSDEVQVVGDIISSEFEIIEAELAHQPTGLDADRFGYLSAHYVVKLKDNRRLLPEWSAFSNLHAEIQVRTVIQHAWSAVSHALQYKQETSVPSSLQRRLYRIAGLFELADEEFVGIRDQKQSAVRLANIAISNGSKNIKLSLATIDAAVAQWSRMDEVRKAAEQVGFSVKGNEQFDISDTDSTASVEIFELATDAGISTVNELISKVDNSDLSLLSDIWDNKVNQSSWHVSDAFIFYLFLMRSLKEKVRVERLTRNGWGKEIAERVVNSL